jgi:DNA-directed RNA polymerase I, II, and III subunit RPABC2
MDTGDIIESGGLDTENVADILEEFNDVEGTNEVEATNNVPDPALAYLYSHHPETILEYVEEVIPKLSTGEAKNTHKSLPFLTTFERTKILGFRATQLSQGARPFIQIPEHIVDVRDIAKLELEQRRLPFILKRPMPNGSFEYWRLNDLMIL